MNTPPTGLVLRRMKRRTRSPIGTSRPLIAVSDSRRGMAAVHSG